MKGEDVDEGTTNEPSKPEIRLTWADAEAKRLELEERRVAGFEADVERTRQDSETLRKDAAERAVERERIEERYREVEEKREHEREEWRAHVAHVERTNNAMLDLWTRIAETLDVIEERRRR